MVERDNDFISNTLTELDEAFKSKVGVRDAALIRGIVEGELGNPLTLLRLISYPDGRVFIDAVEKQGLGHSQVEGRTVYMALEQPVEIEGRQISMLRFKGVRPQLDSNAVGKKYSGDGTPARSLRVDINGNIYMTVPADNPRGGMVFSRAKKEFDFMRESLQATYCMDFPIGLGIYPKWSFRGEPLGYFIGGMEAVDRRISLVGDGVVLHLAVIDKRIGKMFDPDRESEDAIVRRIGETFRSYHDAGKFHRYPHIGNIGIDWDEKRDIYKIILRDLDASVTRESLKGNAQQRRSQEITYRLIDLATIILFFQMDAPLDNKLEKVGTISHLIGPFLEGYFRNETGGDDFDDLVTSVRQKSFAAKFNQMAGIAFWNGTKPKTHIDKLKIDFEDKEFGRLLLALNRVVPVGS